MRIRVKTGDKNISIPIPTGMIFSRASVWTGVQIAKIMCKSRHSHIPDHVKEQMDAFFEKMPEKSLYILCDEFMRIKRKHGNWTLVEVDTVNGETIQITL